MLSKILPGKKWIILIFVLSLINPLNYLLFILYHPSDVTFVGFSDDGLMISLMQAPARNFEDPWSIEGNSVFYNPIVGSTYLFILLGILPLIINIPIYTAFILYKFIFAFVYYIVAYNFMKFFIKDKKLLSTSFLLFLLSAGLGGIIYILSFIFFNQEYLPVIGYAITSEFDELGAQAHSLSHIPRLYYLIPEILTYLTLLAFATKRKILSGFLLGLTGLFYPMAAIISFFVLLIYFLTTNYEKNYLNLVNKIFVNFYIILIIAFIFFTPWLITYLQAPFYFNVIRSSAFGNFPFLKILVSYALTLPFAFYYLMKKRMPVFRNKWFLLSSFLILGLFTIEQIYPYSEGSQLFNKLLISFSLLNTIKFVFNYSFYIEVIVILYTFFVIFIIINSKIKGYEKFLFSWLVFFIIISGISPNYIGLFTSRFGSLILMPLSILAGYGIIEYSKKKKINYKNVLVLIVILSLPSLMGFNARLQKEGREIGLPNVYLSNNDYNALLFLKSQLKDRVFASEKISVFAPVYANQNAVFFSGRVHEYVNDYMEFFGNSSDERKSQILAKYKIKYVFYGDMEKKLNPNFSLQNGKLIYNNITKIFVIETGQ